jgi:aldehyde:ferredoxin oxidoreductase
MIVNETKETPVSIVDKLMKEEMWRQVLSGLTICFFARGIYSMDIVQRALKVAGMDLTQERINEIGKEIYAEKYRFKFDEGFSFDNQKFPKRIFETKSPSLEFDEKYMREGLKYAEKKIKEIL